MIAWANLAPSDWAIGAQPIPRAKLKGARDRKSRAAGHRVKGRKATPTGAVLVEAKRLHRRSPTTGKRRSLRQIAAELAAMGHVNPSTRTPYSATAKPWSLP